MRPFFLEVKMRFAICFLLVVCWAVSACSQKTEYNPHPLQYFRPFIASLQPGCDPNCLADQIRFNQSSYDSLYSSFQQRCPRVDISRTMPAVSIYKALVSICNIRFYQREDGTPNVDLMAEELVDCFRNSFALGVSHSYCNEW